VDDFDKHASLVHMLYVPGIENVYSAGPSKLTALNLIDIDIYETFLLIL